MIYTKFLNNLQIRLGIRNAVTHKFITHIERTFMCKEKAEKENIILLFKY